MNRLITWRPSHFCEKARWALDRARIEYREEPHAAVISWIATYGAGARRTVPALVTPARTLPDSTHILHWVDEQGGAEPLFPPGRAGEDVVALEDDFDRRLGPAARRLFYFHMLSDRPRLEQLLAEAAPRWEALAAPALFPLVRALMRFGLKVDAAGAERSRRVVDRTLSSVAARLADGRRWLAGDGFTAADLTFAALSYPLVWPDAVVVCGIVPPFADLPAALREEIRACRATAAGRFALRLWAEERGAAEPRRTQSSREPPGGGDRRPGTGGSEL